MDAQAIKHFDGVKPEGWGLPGGKVDFHIKNLLNNNSFITSVTVKLIYLDKEDKVLFGLENSLAEEIKNGYYGYEDLMKEIRKTVYFLKEEKSEISNNDVIKIFKKLFGDYGQNWMANDNIETKILLTAIKESLEETGFLIKPKILTRKQVSNNHEMVVCLATIIKGKQQESNNEIKKLEWLPLTELFVSQRNFYASHRNKYLPDALEVLLKENYPFADREEVSCFLKEMKISNKTGYFSHWKFFLKKFFRTLTKKKWKIF